MIVMKFGGSSVATAARIERVAGIVRDRLARRPVVVVSAMALTTRRLLAAGEAAAAGDRAAALAVVEELRAYHEREGRPAVAVTDRPWLDAALDLHFAELARTIDEVHAAGQLFPRLAPRLADAVASCGELVSSAVLTLALRREGVDAELLDCRRLLVTDGDFTRARPLYAETGARLAAAVPPLLARGAVPVVGGYVGATAEGVTTTLGKEGSDFSAAIFGAALGAEEVQIWTDVDGILTADPRLFPGARRVETLSFAEALELAWSGSKKPHPGTLEPASRSGVPIRILSSLHPDRADEEGTLIGRRAAAPPGIKSIACRRSAHLLALRAAGPESGDGFVPGLLAACERFRPALLPLGGSNAGWALALDRADRLEEVRAALGPTAAVDLLPGREVISLVSEDLATSPDLAARTLEAARDWEPRLVLAGVACPAVRLLIDESEVEPVVARLHRELLPGPPEEPVP